MNAQEVSHKKEDIWDYSRPVNLILAAQGKKDLPVNNPKGDNKVIKIDHVALSCMNCDIPVAG